MGMFSIYADRMVSTKEVENLGYGIKIEDTYVYGTVEEEGVVHKAFYMVGAEKGGKTDYFICFGSSGIDCVLDICEKLGLRYIDEYEAEELLYEADADDEKVFDINKVLTEENFEKYKVNHI